WVWTPPRHPTRTREVLPMTDAPGFTTRAIHAGDAANPTRAVTTPIFQTSTFAFDSADEGAAMFAARTGGHVYSRWSNPNVAELGGQGRGAGRCRGCHRRGLGHGCHQQCAAGCTGHR